MKIWTKRAAGVGAIIGGLLIAGSVAASASDLPPAGALSKLPLAGKAVAQKASALPRQSSVVPQQATATPQEADDDSDVPTSGTRTGTAVGSTNVNAPINTCVNTIAVSGVATCRNNQDNVAASSAHVGGVGGVDNGDVLKTATAGTNTNTPLNTCTNDETGTLGGLTRCKNSQRNTWLDETSVGGNGDDR